MRLPLMTLAAARSCAPRQMAAIGFLPCAKCRTTSSTGVNRRYSGARPPGITSAS